MALESSIVPIPSEVVIPPAAFWASQGRFDFWLVVLAGTAGSLFGSLFMYFASRAVGIPFLNRYGKYVFLPPEKLRFAEIWVLDHGPFGVFFARLLPVVRHLISIPAGLLSMPVARFSAATTLGAFLWCLVLAVFGAKVIGEHPDLIASPPLMIEALKAQLHWFVLGAVVLGGLLLYVKVRMTRSRNRPLAST